MVITEALFQAFLKCETKSYLHSSRTPEDGRESKHLQKDALEKDLQQYYTQSFQVNELVVPSLRINCLVQAQGLQSHMHALECVVSSEPTEQDSYIPIRFVPREKLKIHDKLLLAFDALVLSAASGKTPLFGKIIHGDEHRIVKVKLTGLIDKAKVVVANIVARQASQTPPQLVLIKHCAECEFQQRCRQAAIEKDELTLLSGMSEKERKKQHNKGIFSVTQLSYTFRARRKPKRLAAKADKYSHSLKALAIRERKIYVVGRPELNINKNPVYFDIEGLPDRNFYYLIGLRFKTDGSFVQHSFWANTRSEERDIWSSFLHTLQKAENPQLIFYGSYETTFLRRMKERYPDTIEDHAFLDQLVSEAVNLLQVIYAYIYFPTYSNGLKEIAQYLGSKWSDRDASGFRTTLWRAQWELSNEFSLRQKLVTYNAEDCEALEKVANAIARLCQSLTNVEAPKTSEVVHTDSLKHENLYHFGNNTFTMPELEYINKAAYWDYQRERVYARSAKQLKRVSSRKKTRRAGALPINRVVDCQPPTSCPNCRAISLQRQDKESKTVYDLKFSQAGIKRWIVRYLFHHYSCAQCGTTFSSHPNPWTGSKYGPNVVAYLLHQIIELRLPQQNSAQSLKQLFGLNISRFEVNRQKAKAARSYKETYEAILNKIVRGKLIHADETKISIGGESAYVWILTSLEEVVYLYSKTREGDFLQELLKDFNGVLISDFYAAYDSINCHQQKCLIHLMRDLNDELLKQPFNEEFKGLVGDFATLLKPMVETIDKFGLKARFLRKHKVFVRRFYKEISERDYNSEIAVKYKKRFEKNREKLFTFLDHDGVPWNNNNAEHTIKAFAKLRRIIGGTSTEKGMQEYLIFLSICETCKYKGASFLDFLRSGEKDIDIFINKN